MQLSQPVKGVHPAGSGVSALDHLMRDWATVPEDRGIFLAKTWRMHPNLCRFVSDAFLLMRRLEVSGVCGATDADRFPATRTRHSPPPRLPLRASRA